MCVKVVLVCVKQVSKKLVFVRKKNVDKKFFSAKKVVKVDKITCIKVLFIVKFVASKFKIKNLC
jgi:hypothetical protein